MKTAKQIYANLKNDIITEYKMRTMALPDNNKKYLEEHKYRLTCLEVRIRVQEEILEVAND